MNLKPNFETVLISVLKNNENNRLTVELMNGIIAPIIQTHKEEMKELEDRLNVANKDSPCGS